MIQAWRVLVCGGTGLDSNHTKVISAVFCPKMLMKWLANNLTCHGPQISINFGTQYIAIYILEDHLPTTYNTVCGLCEQVGVH